LACATDAARRKNRQKNRKRRQRRPGPVSGIACLATDSTKILPSNSNKVAILLVKTARILCYNQRQIQNIQAMEWKMEKDEKVDETKLPISQVSKEEKDRRRNELKETLKRASKEARERGLTNDILEKLLKDV